MTIRNILTYPDPFLRETTKPVDHIDKDIQILIDDMIETMYDAPGSGLAANQIGSDKSVIVCDQVDDEGKRSALVLINPSFLKKEGLVVSENEGCLSVPDFQAHVKRAASVTIKGLDREGNSVVLEENGRSAVVLQHEIDHLKGILFIDHISSLKREMYKRRIKKQLKKR